MHIKKEACWAISNITAGTADQIEAVLRAQILEPLVNLLLNSDFKVKKEACWAICNATSIYETRSDLIKYIASENVIKALCSILKCNDNKIITIVLESIENILKCGADMTTQNGINPYTIMIEECQGLQAIEELQYNNDTSIYQKSRRLIDIYFQADSVEMSATYFADEQIEGPEGNAGDREVQRFQF